MASADARVVTPTPALSGRLLRSAGVSLGIGVCAVAALFALGLPGGSPEWFRVSGFPSAVLIVSASGWACERVWRAALGPLFGESRGWLVTLTRLPFWYMAGGMGVTLWMLIAKKYFLADIHDIPVKPYFTGGAEIYLAVQLALSLLDKAVWRLSGRRAFAGRP
jgi:hypothetical protein